jgi:hypothetical protein
MIDHFVLPVSRMWTVALYSNTFQFSGVTSGGEILDIDFIIASYGKRAYASTLVMEAEYSSKTSILIFTRPRGVVFV